MTWLIALVSYAPAFEAAFEPEHDLTFRSRHLELRRAFDGEIDGILARTSEPATVRNLSRWRFHGDPGRIYLCLPSDEDATNPNLDLQQLRLAHAEACFLLAGEALAADDVRLTFQLLNEVAYFAPDHEATQWLKRLGALGAATVTTKVSRRPNRDLNWPAGYHQISTPSFVITTNDAPATAQRLAKQLHILEAAWRQLFFEVWSNKVELERSRERRVTRRRRRHRVVLFRTREDYTRHISRIEPRASQTAGYYHADSRTAFFVGGASPSESTWFHEASHQLFFENISRSTDAIENNFWVIEGIALYMESLQRCRRWITLGGLEASRLQFARFRAQREGFRVPLQALGQLGRIDLQQHSRIGAIYSQAAGMTHWLMHAEQQRHQSDFIQFIESVHQGGSRAGDLEKVTDSSFTTCDQQYAKSLVVDDGLLSRMDPDVSIRNLCIGGNPISDEGLRGIDDLSDVKWLDLSGTQVTDDGMQLLSTATKLEQLSLAATNITDVSVLRLNAESLAQLDLSNTRVSDAAVKSLVKFNRLKSLWLSGTQVTDGAVDSLIRMRQIQDLDLSDTRVTAAGRTRLRAALPDATIK